MINASALAYNRVLAIGVFDLFHIGHLRYLHFAAQQGEQLVVAVTPNSICQQTKGKSPIIGQQQRMDIVQAMASVDEVAVLPTTTEHAQQAAAWIAAWRINLVVAGGSWQGSQRWQRLTPVLKIHNIDVMFAPHTDDISTTDIIERIQSRNAASRTTLPNKPSLPIGK